MVGDRRALLGRSDMLRGDRSGLYGTATLMLMGDCTGVIGDCTRMVGDCTGVIGDLDSIPRRTADGWLYISDHTTEAGML